MKDLRTRVENTSPQNVLGRRLDGFMEASLSLKIGVRSPRPWPGTWTRKAESKPGLVPASSHPVSSLQPTFEPFERARESCGAPA